MSLRPYAEQLAHEEEGRRAFLAELGPAAEHFERITDAQVRDAVACDRHGRPIGQWCGATVIGGGFACVTRRRAAAEQAAGVAGRAG